jgi:hypothetical protein
LRSLSFFFAPAFICALLASTAQAAPPRCLAGQYDGGEPEIAAGLVLASDGRFRYALSYGALDEEARGRWESDGAKVFLTSDPVTPPRFSLVSQGPAPAGEFRVGLDLPDSISPQYFNAMLTMKDGSTRGRPLGYEDWIVPLEPGEEVVSVKLQLAVLGLESKRFTPSTGAATEMRFTFAPNDLGKAAFAHEPLTIDGRELKLSRHDRTIRFRPQTGGC